MENMTLEEKLALMDKATGKLAKIATRLCRLELNVLTVVQLIAQLQLAFRHPTNTGDSRTEIETLCRDLIELLDPDKGDVYQFLMLGFDETSINKKEMNLCH